MKSALKKQMKEMTEEELEDILRRDYLRKLTRYKLTDDFYRKKYGMDFSKFQRANIVKKHDYSFEVESDAQEWEIAIEGTKTIEKKLKELAGEN
jgi:hypothetical protein